MRGIMYWRYIPFFGRQGTMKNMPALTHSPINPYNNGTIDLPPGDYISARFYRGGMRWSEVEPKLDINSHGPGFKHYGRIEDIMAFSNMDAALKFYTKAPRRKIEFERIDIFGGRCILLYFPNTRNAIGPYQVELSETFFMDSCKSF